MNEVKMTRSQRTANACIAMKQYGISQTKVKAALRKLLKVYADQWEFIEEDNYGTLRDFILEPDAKKYKEVKSKKKQASTFHDHEPLKSEPAAKKLRLQCRRGRASVSTTGKQHGERNTVKFSAYSQSSSESDSEPLIRKIRRKQENNQTSNTANIADLDLVKNSQINVVEDELLSSPELTAQPPEFMEINSKSPVSPEAIRNLEKVGSPQTQLQHGQVVVYTESCGYRRTKSSPGDEETSALVPVPLVDASTEVGGSASDKGTNSSCGKQDINGAVVECFIADVGDPCKIQESQLSTSSTNEELPLAVEHPAPKVSCNRDLSSNEDGSGIKQLGLITEPECPNLDVGGAVLELNQFGTDSSGGQGIRPAFVANVAQAPQTVLLCARDGDFRGTPVNTAYVHLLNSAWKKHGNFMSSFSSHSTVLLSFGLDLLGSILDILTTQSRCSITPEMSKYVQDVYKDLTQMFQFELSWLEPAVRNAQMLSTLHAKNAEKQKLQWEKQKSVAAIEKIGSEVRDLEASIDVLGKAISEMEASLDVDKDVSLYGF